MSWLLSQDLEFVGSQSHKSLKHFGEELYDVFSLANSDRDTDGVDGGLNHSMLELGFADHDWVEKQFWVILELDLWVNLTLDEWRWEVTEVEDRVQSVTNSLQVVSLRKCHHKTILLIISSTKN